MSRPNIFTSAVEPDPEEPDGFIGGALHVSREAGASELVAKLIEVQPGQHVCPYHYEYVEEWLVVVSGQVQIRTPAGAEQLSPGDVVVFPVGPDGGHQVSSPAAATEPARVFMFSADADPAVCVYPESDKLAVYHRGVPADNVFVRRAEPSSHLDYYDGETA